MKTPKFYSLFSFLLIAFLSISCVKDGEFDLPDIRVEATDIVVNSSISAIKSALQQEYNATGNLIHTFYDHENNPTFVQGYVVSTDATGNFYKKLIIQDEPENPTNGIELVLNKNSLNETYDVGRKVYLKLNGLSVSYDDGESTNYINPTNEIPGTYVLGVLKGGQVDEIPSTSIEKHVFRAASVTPILPTHIHLAAITEAHINTMIQLPSAQVAANELAKTFAGEANDEYDGFRTIFECDTQKTIQMQTSTFASFKSHVVPSGKGAFTGVLSKDYRSEFLVVIINTPSDMEFTDPNRCDPPMLNCGEDSVGGDSVLIEEDFEESTSMDDITSKGWSNVNVNGGNTSYSLEGYTENRFVQISAYNSNESPLEVWLVSPEIDLETTIDEELTFETNTGYDNGAALTTYVSSNFNGEVTTATWLKLDAHLSSGPSFGYNNFLSSGSINISCLSGTIHIAFRYQGRDGGVTTTFQVDNVKVTGK